MDQVRFDKLRLRGAVGFALLALAFCAVSVAPGSGADTKAPDANAEPPKAPAAEKKPEKKKLTGAELYAVHCNRCHPERYATEFTATQWKTIMTHMRVRANLPAAQAKAILKFLQEDSGS
jgi:mono/diheme cytochrome c family protein